MGLQHAEQQVERFFETADWCRGLSDLGSLEGRRVIVEVWDELTVACFRVDVASFGVNLEEEGEVEGGGAR